MEDITKIKKELAWYRVYADQVEAINHRVHNYACEEADRITGTTQYPYSEGDDYWTLDPYVEMEYEDSQGIYQNGALAVQSCWDDQSEVFHKEDPDRKYYNSLEEILLDVRDEHGFIKVECFNCDMSDIETGDFFVAEETGKFRKSY